MALARFLLDWLVKQLGEVKSSVSTTLSHVFVPLLDSDKDGVVTRSELKRMQLLAGMFGAGGVHSFPSSVLH